MQCNASSHTNTVYHTVSLTLTYEHTLSMLAGVGRSLLANNLPLDTSYHHTLSSHLILIPYSHAYPCRWTTSLSTHHIITPSHHIISSHLSHTLSLQTDDFPLNTSYHHTLSVSIIHYPCRWTTSQSSRSTSYSPSLATSYSPSLATHP